MDNHPQNELELAPLKSVSTYIRSDKNANQVRDDRIHLRQEIWQVDHE